MANALDDPLSTWYTLLFWFVFLAFGLMSTIVAYVVYRRAASGTWRRITLMPAISQAVSIPVLLIFLIISVLRHNYAAAAAFGSLAALLFIALKIIGGAALVAAGGKGGADIYDWGKARLFKPKTSTHPPDA